MKVAVIDINGKKTGRNVELSEAVFGIEPNDHAIYLDVKQHLANRRQGTHKSKERADITGSTRKIKKQKGTGTARAGSIKSPIFRGGGRVFGPRPRNYGIKLNKKVKRLARISALSAKTAAGVVKVVEYFSFDAPKTKEFINVMNSLEVNTNKTLFVVPEFDNNVLLSSRNLPNSKVMLAQNLNTLDIMKAHSVVISEGSVAKIKETLSK